MHIEKPKMDIAKPGFSKLFDILTVALFAAFLTYLLLQWSELPDRIPAHFGMNGEVDRWGSRIELVLLPIIAGAMWIGLTFLEKYPHLFNYINLKPDNIETQYRYGVVFMNVVKNLSTLLLLFAGWQMMEVALGKAASLYDPMLIGLLVLLFGAMGYYFYRVMKL